MARADSGLPEQISEKIIQLILDEHLEQGDRLPKEAVLVERLGAGRSTVREAMKLLCHEGLLTAQPRRGMTVTQLTAAQVAEARLLCHLLAQHLSQLKAQPLHRCTELTERLHAVAQARLHLALGPIAHTPVSFSTPQAVHQHAALAL